MLINARDPHQWTYLRNLPQKKKKKTPDINQCGEKGDGEVLHTRRFCVFEKFRTIMRFQNIMCLCSYSWYMVFVLFVASEFILVWIWWTNWCFFCYVIVCLVTTMVVGINIGTHDALEQTSFLSSFIILF
jgi:hypothetical protein